MEQNNVITDIPEPQKTNQELVRPDEGRMLAGVAQGLANRFNIPVLLVRAAFVFLAISGGVGFALYATGWFLMRSENVTQSPAERLFSGEAASS